MKIKTQITKYNSGEISRIRQFIEGLGLKFQPSYDLHARLDGDSMPCNLRILPNEIPGPNGDKCAKAKNRIPNATLFRCAIGGGDGIQIDPYGNMFACNLIRKPDFNLLKFDIDYATDKLLSLVRNRKFVTDSRCNGYSLREKCNWCPGRAYLEKGDTEAPIEYYCKLARLM